MVLHVGAGAAHASSRPWWQNGCMKFRTGVILGFAAGYVLGAKAGRERYEQIGRAAAVVANNPPIRRLLDESKTLADQGTFKARESMSDQLRDVSGTIRDKAG